MTEIEVLDPATVRPIAAVEDMDETTVDAAVRRARAAFDNGGGWWPGTPDEERGRCSPAPRSWCAHKRTDSPG